MSDEKGKSVERYKLTPEQKDFQKRFKSIQNARKFLGIRLGEITKEAAELRYMMKYVEEEASGLTPPKEMTHELPGMNFGVTAPAEEVQNKEKFMLGF